MVTGSLQICCERCKLIANFRIISKLFILIPHEMIGFAPRLVHDGSSLDLNVLPGHWDAAISIQGSENGDLVVAAWRAVEALA